MKTLNFLTACISIAHTKDTREAPEMTKQRPRLPSSSNRFGHAKNLKRCNGKRNSFKREVETRKNRGRTLKRHV